MTNLNELHNHVNTKTYMTKVYNHIWNHKCLFLCCEKFHVIVSSHGKVQHFNVRRFLFFKDFFNTIFLFFKLGGGGGVFNISNNAMVILCHIK